MLKYLNEGQKNKLKEAIGEESYNKIVGIEKEITPDMIPKSRFDEVVVEKNTLKADKEALDTKITGYDELKTKITGYETEITSLKDNYSKLKIDSAVENGIIKRQGKNIKAISSLIESDKIKIGENGEIEGLTEQLDKIKTDNDYLFGTEVNNNGTNLSNTSIDNNDVSVNDLLKLM